MILGDLARRAHTARRSSGTATRPTFASRVENAYFVVSAACVAVSALNNADLPTFGRPTIPQLKPMSLPTQNRHDRARPGHPRRPRRQLNPWVAGTSPAMTALFMADGSDIQKVRSSALYGRSSPSSASRSGGVKRRATSLMKASGAPSTSSGIVSATASSNGVTIRSEEHTSELQSLAYLVCRLLLEKKKLKTTKHTVHPPSNVVRTT